MKRILFMLVMSIGFYACSVDSEDLNSNEGLLKEYNATINVAGCEPEIHSFGNSGNLEVVNDNDSLYVSFVAANGLSLTKASLHLAGSLSEFPTVGQGNLPPGQLEYQKTFNENQQKYTFSFNLDEIEGCIYIAANGSFSNGAEAGSYWAGDISVNKGNWSYFEYCKQTCIDPCEGFAGAGKDNSITLTLSQITANYNSVSRLETLYSSLLETSVRGTGTFSPSIADLAKRYTEATDKTGAYTSIYTVTKDGCTDTATITINVIP